ncbi:MAG: cytochrome bc complex cytochrome b subunit [Chloroflexota bacterium]|nr:cytochrome bc complex cytochrome b subunit [Chloroflexota bacterium]
MLGLGDLRDLPNEAQRKLDELLRTDWEEKARDKVDETTRAVSGGLSVEELRAVFRGDPPTEKPNPRYKLHTKSFLAHLRPRYYQRASTWFTHTFRLGWFSTFFFLIEIITGIVLMVFYAPTPAEAYGDILNLQSNVPFGQFMRDLHRYGAELMVAAVTLHMMRVYFTGSYKHPRQFTWLTGVVLLLCTLFLSFSGYLLPWDQLAYWAVTIGASMADKAPFVGREVQLLLAGAPAIGANGLLRFYLLHVLLVPLLAILFLSIHYYKVAREHSISLPAVVEEGEMDEDRRKWAKERIDLIPDLLTHEMFLVVAATAFMIVYVTFFYNAPLESHADAFVTPMDTKAPWYFLWIQGMLKLGDPTLMGVILPTIVFGLLFAVPYLDRNPSRLGKNRKIAITLGILFSLLIVILSWMGTPWWGIENPPANRILQDLSPQEGEGPVEHLGYEVFHENLGSYTTEGWELPADPTAFERLFAEFKERVELADAANPEFNNLVGTWVVEQWQPNMVRLHMDIEWDDPDQEDGRNRYNKDVYLHELSHYD